MPLLVNLDRLRGNLEQIWSVLARTGSRILLDQSAFPAPALYPMLGLYLSGTVGRTRAELEQGLRHMDRDSHGRPAPDCSEAEFLDLLPWCSHLVYADLEQWRRFDRAAREYQPSRGFLVSANGYCAGGVPLSELPMPKPKGVSNLCLQFRDPTLWALTTAVGTLEQYYGRPPRLYQLDIGGNWPLTDPAFPLDGFEKLLCDLRDRWSMQVALTVGDAVCRGAVEELPEGDCDLYVTEKGVTKPFTGF